MTYRLKALVSTVIMAPILGGLRWKIFALDFFQRCGTTLYIIEWTVSYALKSFTVNRQWIIRKSLQKYFFIIKYQLYDSVFWYITQWVLRCKVLSVKLCTYTSPYLHELIVDWWSGTLILAKMSHMSGANRINRAFFVQIKWVYNSLFFFLQDTYFISLL